MPVLTHFTRATERDIFLASVPRWKLLCLIACLAGGLGLRAASPAEERAFGAASRAMQDGFYERAERDFGAFATRFAKSELLAEVVQLQAECRFKLKDYDGVIKLLTQHLAEAGSRQDEYLFWLAEAHFQKKNFAEASAQYARLLNQFPESTRTLDASYGHALVLSQLGKPDQTVEVLQTPEGPFQRAAKARPDDETVTRGLLLLGQALFAQKQHAAAEQALNRLNGRKLDPETSWQRQFLLCRIFTESGRLEAARQGATNLMGFAVASGQRALQANSSALEGEILERLQDLPGAVQAYERNFADGLPEERRIQALTNVIKLTLAQNKPAETVQKLSRFIEQHPKDASLDLVRLTIGELQLKEYSLFWTGTRTNANAELLGAGTNLLQQARQQFERLIADFPASPRLAKAHLDRGWCLWYGLSYADSLADFKTAAERLPPAEDQATARIKWADAQFELRDYAGAVTNYQKVVKDHAGSTLVKRELVEQALYQIVRTGIALTNLDLAADGMRTLLAKYADSAFAPRAMLLVGQSLSNAGKTSEARTILQDCATRFAKSELAPEATLALAMSYQVDREWPQAIEGVTQWLARHPQHPSRPQVEFNLGQLHSLAGHETNALAIYTNFVVQFPTNELARVAQMCVADYFFNQGQQDSAFYVVAEENYQRVFQNTNWPPSELTFEARFLAGRAAFARSGFTEAREYFTNLINDAKCPSNLVGKALFALGDTYVEEPSDPDKSLKKFELAINAFGTISTLFPGSPLEAPAWGKIASCHFQLASQDASRYAKAMEFFQKTVDSPQASVGVRSQARCGLGLVTERQAAALPEKEKAAALDTALNHYLDVFYQKNLRESESADSYWTREAGMLAAKLLENLGQWDKAINIYTGLQQMFPVLQKVLDKKIDLIRQQIGPAKS